jgi:hypothetical protein
MKTTLGVIVGTLALLGAGTGTAAVDKTVETGTAGTYASDISELAGFGGKPTATSPLARPLFQVERKATQPDLTQLGKPSETSPGVVHQPGRPMDVETAEIALFTPLELGKPSGTSPPLQRR